MGRRIPILFFLGLAVYSAFLGLSDDEAYYWVLAQKPALGYAFHPPAVAWLIAVFQRLFGGLLGADSPFVVRLPAVFCSTLILSLCLNWLDRSGLASTHKNRAAAVVLAFFSFFSLSWMMVPDLPLFLGWTLAFTGTWALCFSQSKKLDYWKVGLGVALSILSKFSGILVLFSVGLALFCWAPPRVRRKAIWGVGLGFVAAVLPTLYWNAQHEWGSLLFQLRDRHTGAALSGVRWLRFWVVEAVLMGPALLVYTGVLFWRTWQTRKRAEGRLLLFFGAWIFPATIFWIQPLFSDFKLHWAFIAWWPVVLAMARNVSQDSPRWARLHIAYGFVLGVVILLSCYLPFLNRGLKQWIGPGYDPRVDVTNDLYGWREWGRFFKEGIGKTAPIPVVGSRYQTASQAAFALGSLDRVTLLPRDLKERDEWPTLESVDHQGPAWPRLKSPVFFVLDNRYGGTPEFSGANCYFVNRFEKQRGGLLVKWIDLWRCDPLAGNL